MTYGFVETTNNTNTCPVRCSFAYHSVVPPTHCPYCGRCLGCGAPEPVRPAPYPTPWPRPYGPVWYQPSPYYTGDPPYSDNPFPNVVIT